MQTPERRRLLGLLRQVCLLLAAGILYAWFAGRFGGVPCLFYRITGLKCPGCGVTRMCLSLLHGHWREAFRQNAAVLCLLPAGAVLAVLHAASYVRTGVKRLSRPEAVLVWCMVGALLLFGAARNLAGFWGLTF